ncbi:MAG: histidine triad nucleotide-binding protein [Deltaproteobacteria bacterium]
MSDCIFCKIVQGEIPAKVVYEDEKVIAFEDIKPAAPVHVLIIPKQHIDCVSQLDEQSAKVLPDIFLAINKVAEKLGIKERGFRVIVNNGIEGGQVVFHLHFHLLGGKTLGSLIV